MDRRCQGDARAYHQLYAPLAPRLPPAPPRRPRGTSAAERRAGGAPGVSGEASGVGGAFASGLSFEAPGEPSPAPPNR
jgi:hypothetical protein